MVAMGYMEHGHGLYRLGPKSFRLAADILAVRRFPALVRPILQDLAAKSGETVFLVVLDRLAQRVTYADIIDSANPVRYTVPTGTTRPLYVSSGGQMLLAYQEPAWIDTYIRSTRLEPLTAHTITDPKQLRDRLATIRREGFSISLGETVPGAAGIAAPIFNADGSVTAGLLIGAPLDRFEQELPELKRLLREATTRIAGIAQALVEDAGRG
jgi:IclR family transcriptional regulator, acetate operon repressor